MNNEVIGETTCIGCESFKIHDGHYFYCSSQDAPNKHAKPDEYAYPWHGAGKQLRNPIPDSGCPIKGKTK